MEADRNVGVARNAPARRNPLWQFVEKLSVSDCYDFARIGRWFDYLRREDLQDNRDDSYYETRDLNFPIGSARLVTEFWRWFTDISVPRTSD